jgi:hypothetical protein
VTVAPAILAAADRLAKVKGYISIWSPGREVRQHFIDAARLEVGNA